MKARRLKNLRVKRVDLVERGANQEANVVLFKAQWSAAEINNLPDSAFAVIAPGGTKDDEGKTVPRTLRHLPFKGPDGKVDLPHLRNALARLPQSDLSPELQAQARARLQAAAKEAGVGQTTEEKAEMMKCPKCEAEVGKEDKFCSQCGTKQEMEKQDDMHGSHHEDAKKAAKAAKETFMAENQEQIVKKLQDDLKAATDLADEEAKKRDAIEKSLKEQTEAVASLKKQFEDAQAEIRKAKDEAKLAEFKKAVDEFEHLPVKADVFAPVLKKCAEALDEAGYAELMRVLKAADAASADNFSEIGAPGNASEPRTVAAEVDAKAEELLKSESGLSKSDAYARVMAQNPKLAARYRREARTKQSSQEDES